MYAPPILLKACFLSNCLLNENTTSAEVNSDFFLKYFVFEKYTPFLKWNTYSKPLSAISQDVASAGSNSVVPYLNWTKVSYIAVAIWKL